MAQNAFSPYEESNQQTNNSYIMENTIKKSATYGDWTIDFMSDKKLVIKKNGEVCDKVKTEVIAIANAIGYDYDPEWSTGYLGFALLEIINMKKAQSLNIDGRTKVNKLKRDFQCLFNASLRVYDGVKLANRDDKLSVLRKEGCVGGEMVCTPNDTVEYFKYFMKHLFGIKVEVATCDDKMLVIDEMPLGMINEISNNPSKEEMKRILEKKS